MRFGWAHVSKRWVTGCTIIFSAQIEMRTKYVNCPVTVVIVVRFLYLNGEIFTSVFSEVPSPALLFDLDVAKLLVSPPMGVKDIGLLCRDPCMLNLSLLGVWFTPLSLLRVLRNLPRKSHVPLCESDVRCLL